MTNWTKGPWVNGEHGIIQDGASSYKDRILVSGVRMPMGRDDEAEANANLIAAAPELYEALEAIKEDLMARADQGENGCPAINCSRDAWLKMVDAMAKARGES